MEQPTNIDSRSTDLVDPDNDLLRRAGFDHLQGPERERELERLVRDQQLWERQRSPEKKLKSKAEPKSKAVARGFVFVHKVWS